MAGSSPAMTIATPCVLCRARRAGQLAHEARDRQRFCVVALPSRSRLCLERADQRRTDHQGFGAAARCARPASAVRTPKPTATGSVVCRLMRATAARDLGGIGRRSAGDAGDRDVVDEARGIREHRGSRRSSVVGVARRMKFEPGLERRQAKLVVLLGRQVDDDQAVDACGLCVSQKARPRRRCRPGCSIPSARSASCRRPCETRAPGERLRQGLPGLERALTAAWIAGPSAIGSVNGMPSSITSAPAFGSA